MKRIVLTLAFLFGAVQAQAADPAPTYPAHTIPGSQLRALPKNADGRSYQLHVQLPASFASEPKRRYPVLYVTDGYWDFATVVASYNNLNYDKVVPEFIIVGLGYAGDNLDYGQLRAWELSPVRMNPLAANTGNADKFLDALEKQIFPLVERDYRADPAQRFVAGSSLGGLFVLHAMYARPTLFQGYIAASPAVVVGNDWIIGRAKAYAASGKPIKARLYVTGAEHEWPGFLAGIKRYQALLPELKHPELVWQNRTIDGERHAGTKAESYTRGMRYVFEPLAPEKGPSRD
ncbi:alpha/beta hydrolase-fold protein [Roseateles asaccharophilus]|uniref:Alpha/beta superfamily hydrolase n=1 Tax=Roseateles asaccharophilus TaxID=582607 RepID=A0ABU2AD94_9BURK|nr:alpha/beta hydrolase-fold protein [Roseateles asaccharophilus]MDR7335171.1 putative alpha/beta superfamily hydrolase [Roseateles asaccharophilus]